MCIEQLRPDLRNCYEALAIFNEDVNITPKVSHNIISKTIEDFKDNIFLLIYINLTIKSSFRLWKFFGNEIFFKLKN